MDIQSPLCTVVVDGDRALHDGLTVFTPNLLSDRLGLVSTIAVRNTTRSPSGTLHVDSKPEAGRTTRISNTV